jgi:hypothetical protein
VAVAEETAAEMPADEACTAGDENVHDESIVMSGKLIFSVYPYSPSEQKPYVTHRIARP